MTPGLIWAMPALLSCSGEPIDILYPDDACHGCIGVPVFKPGVRYQVTTWLEHDVVLVTGQVIPAGLGALTAFECEFADADTNRDGVVDGLDFGAWLGAFNRRDPVADLNCDGLVDGLDAGEWTAAFNHKGCRQCLR